MYKIVKKEILVPNLIYMKVEVPEIAQNIVEIKAIAREPGDRTKIAVYSNKENVDNDRTK